MVLKLEKFYNMESYVYQKRLNFSKLDNLNPLDIQIFEVTIKIIQIFKDPIDIPEFINQIFEEIL